MNRILTMCLLLLALAISASAQVSDDGKPVVVVTNADIVGNVTWTAGNVYNLSGFMYVESGEKLTIEPGTIVKGNPGQGANASALIVARGGQIFANGTQALPVIFTSIQDDLDDPSDIPLDANGRGLWGGLIILGNAKINTTTGVGQIEGIPETEPRGAYGGNDDNDNSGVLTYVSIRHGGSEIGAANEINGLTMGAVGRGTTVSHVEVLFNLDDGYEWFGGTVNADHLVTAFCGDDAFDYDEGWRGGVEYSFCIMSTDVGDRGGEHDGGTSPVDGTPYATPLFSNVTYFGRGAVNGGQRCFEIRDNSGGGWYNSIFYDHGTYGIKVEENLAEPTDSQDRLAAGHIKFMNNLWYEFGDGNSTTAICNGVATTEAAIFGSGNDLAADPGIASVSRIPNGLLDPRPTNLFGAGWGGWVDPQGASGFFPAGAEIDVSYPAYNSGPYPYAGAFDPDLPMTSQWTDNWTFLSFAGYLSTAPVACCKLRGDNNHSGAIDISDLTFQVDFLFGGGASHPCEDEGDFNASGAIDITDLTDMVDFLFGGGSGPSPC
ncbi:MAG: T9SS C-terminal target domain-containing protein [bacterium]|nr:T9SS C-terminal target domain-containing protein [bacterium]